MAKSDSTPILVISIRFRKGLYSYRNSQPHRQGYDTLEKEQAQETHVPHPVNSGTERIAPGVVMIMKAVDARTRKNMMLGVSMRRHIFF
jgi:hypothetical protein